MSKLMLISNILKELSNEELNKLDILLWSEINSRDPEYFSGLENSDDPIQSESFYDDEDTEC